MIQELLSVNNNAFKWLDVINPTAEELAELSEKYLLDKSSIQDCMQPEHLPKIEQQDDTLFIITRYYDEECLKTADSIHDLSRKMAIFYRKELLITIHRKAFTKLTDYASRKNETLKLADHLFNCIRFTLATYEEPIQKLSTDIDFYESRIFLKKKIPDLLKNLFLIKRRIYVIRRLLNLSKEIIEKVHPASFKSPIYQDLKDYYIKIDTLVEDGYNDIQGLLNIYISLSSQRTNEVMRTLTVFTAFFLPLTFIVGLYGMNFEYMPELKYPMAYPIVIAVMICITIFIYIWFRRRGWI